MKFKFPVLLVALTLLLAVVWPPRTAEAACTRCCNCETIRNYIVEEIKKHETWLKDEFWAKYLQPALAIMTNQINLGLITQTASIGGFLDAQNNIEKRHVLQELSAETANNYVPSEQLCRFASLSQSLAESESKGQSNQLQLMERSLARQLGTKNMSSSEGGSTDVVARMKNFMGRYCSSSDNNGQMSTLCKNSGEDKYLNADIDYVRTFDSKPTLDVDFTQNKGTPTDDEQNILALSDNLFANDLFPRISKGDLAPNTRVKNSRIAYMDMRSLVAKRSVAENSFATLVGQKAQGAEGSKTFIQNILKELGLSDETSLSYLGGKPSYDAQMEVLTKKIYQSPSFYVNLMDNPANVQRQYAAMQSFGLMQQRDIFESILRSEMILSLIVELEVSKYQDQVQGLMDKK